MYLSFNLENVWSFAIDAKPFAPGSFVFMEATCFNLEIMCTDPKFCQSTSNIEICYIIEVWFEFEIRFKRCIQMKFFIFDYVLIVLKALCSQIFDLDFLMFSNNLKCHKHFMKVWNGNYEFKFRKLWIKVEWFRDFSATLNCEMWRHNYDQQNSAPWRHSASMATAAGGRQGLRVADHVWLELQMEKVAKKRNSQRMYQSTRFQMR